MKTRLTVVGLGGSLCKRSTSLAALKIALEGTLWEKMWLCAGICEEV